MVNGKFVSSKRVIDKLYQDFPHFDIGFPYSTLIEWIGSALSELKVPCYYVDKITDGNLSLNHKPYIEIQDYRGKLPCDMYLLRQAAAVVETTPECAGKQAFLNQYGCVIPVNGIAYYDFNETDTVTADCGGLIPAMVQSETSCSIPHCRYVPMRWATNTFHKGYHVSDLDCRMCSDLTYTINNNYIFTSFKKGKVALSYLAVPTDEEGLPIIPDSETVINYVVWYVALKYSFQLWSMGKIADKVYEETKGYAQLYYMKSRNEGKMPKTLDEWESYKNLRIRRIPKMYDHRSFYKNLQSPQETWLHPKASAWGNTGLSNGII